MNPKLWVCQVRKEAFVGGESQRCRHTETCANCGGQGLFNTLRSASQTRMQEEICSVCKGSGQVSECGVMELIGGEPVEWCVVHGEARAPVSDYCWDAQAGFEIDRTSDPCQFESQVRVGS